MTAPVLACLLCGNTEARLLVTGYDRMQARDADYPYVRCAACGLVRQALLPAAGDIPGLYPADYEAHINSSPRNLARRVNRLAIKYFYGVDSVSRPRLLRAMFRVMSGRIMNGIREPHGANQLLDIGCGSGQLLEVYRALGWCVYGVEINPRACAACRERDLPIHEGTVFDVSLSAHQFDMILLSHVIEHLLDPVAVLERVAELLALNGKVVVTTPNTRGIGLPLYGSCWFHLDAPRHIFLFDPHTIRLLARRAGLTVARVVTRSSAQTLCASRHYTKTQGERLPAGLGRRQALLQDSARRRKRYRAYRNLVSPFTLFLALLGRGDILEAELRAI